MIVLYLFFYLFFQFLNKIKYGDKLFLVSVKAKNDMVDINQTLSNNILYPNEKEITLKDKGKGVKILSIKEINK